VSGKVEGRLESVVDGRAIGWAWDPERPEEAIEVEVLVDGREVGAGLADIERQVLAAAGMGEGRYGFDVALPEELGTDSSHTIRVTAGSGRLPVLPIELFETVARRAGGAWSQTTFVPEGLAGFQAPFVPEEEPPPDPGEAALVGRGDWLFLRDDANLTLDQLTGATLLSAEDADRLAKLVANRHRSLRELGVPYLSAVAPMKERLYENLLPEGLSLEPRSPAEMVNEALLDASDGDVLDLLPALRKGLEGGDMFPRTASVWSDRGAFLAYRELMREARKRVISLEEPLPEDRLKLVRREGFRGDLAEKPKFAFAGGEFVAEANDADWAEEVEVAAPSGLRSLRMPAPKHLEVTPGRAPHLYEIPDESDLPRAVLIGDACCLPMIQWLAEHFRRFVFLWTLELPMEAIELEMPDIVIHVISERHLVHAP
jgi:SGNH hydrolase-like domain, acetyltransferase AlgX